VRARVFGCFLLAVFAVSACNSVNLWDELLDIINQRNCSHDWSAWTVTEDPTCTDYGEETRTCARINCGQSETRSVDAFDHDWDYASGAIQPTCMTTGSGKRECTLCWMEEDLDIIPIDDDAHEWGGWAPANPATCLAAGTQTRICNHNNTHIQTEADPAAFPLGHTANSWTVATLPTCTAEGEETGTCTRNGCNASLGTRSINALGHAFTQWKQTAAATCIAAGTETEECNRCLVLGTVTKTVGNPLGHTLGAWEQHGTDEERRGCIRIDDCGHYFTLMGKFIPGTSISLRMAHILDGTFQMGQPGFVAPVHSVTLTRGFYMGIYPVTQEQYQAVMGANPSAFSADPAVGEEQTRRPVENVNWYHAIAFCNRLSILQGLNPVYTITGMNNTDPDAWLYSAVPTADNATWDAVTVNWNANGYRLPTEAEWEYACRAVTTTPWYTGDTADAALDAAAWYSVNSNSRTHEVGLKTPNAWGLYDMMGNVFEWCWDWRAAYTADVKTDPRGPASGTFRVVRGGSWIHTTEALRSAYRNDATPSDRINTLGFRVVRTAL
jgi:formylglycine-generating enzyme required for sulfatase activity